MKLPSDNNKIVAGEKKIRSMAEKCMLKSSASSASENAAFRHIEATNNLSFGDWPVFHYMFQIQYSRNFRWILEERRDVDGWRTEIEIRLELESQWFQLVGNFKSVVRVAELGFNIRSFDDVSKNERWIDE